MPYVMRTELAEGKTKVVWSTDVFDLVIVVTKDDITAGDGEKHDVIPGLGDLRNQMTCNCFTLLEKNGVKTHFSKQLQGASFLARKCYMIPIELVARGIAYGSYLKRNPDVASGIAFETPVVEFFLKDDHRHDPLMIWNKVLDSFKLYDAKKPVSPESFFGDLPRNTPFIPTSFDEVELLSKLLSRTFIILRDAWRKQGVVLVDLKIEAGCDVATGELLVADVIDNDSWRIWPHGDPAQMMDKQVYRDSDKLDPELVQKLLANYTRVVEATSKFLS